MVDKTSLLSLLRWLLEPSLEILEMMMIMCDEHSENTKLFWGSVNKELHTNLKNTFLWFFVGFKSREIVSWFS